MASDLRLAAAVAAPDGVLAIGDMLHPVYPTLALTAHAFLGAEPDWPVLAIIDREDIVGAAKYLLCRKPAAAGYETWLRSAFAARVLSMDADFQSYRAVAITPEPKLADIG